MYIYSPTIELEQPFKTLYKPLYRYGMKLSRDKELVQECIRCIYADLLSGSISEGKNSVKVYTFFALRQGLIENSAVKSQLPEMEFELDEFKNSEIQTKLLDVANNLTSQQREVVYLKYMAALSYQEIAHIMEIPGTEVKQCFAVSMQAIRRELNARIN